MPKSSLHSLDTQPLSWQQQLSRAITDPLALLDFLQLDKNHFPECQQAGDDFKLKVPLSYARKMEPKNPHDPLFLQVMAQGKELFPSPGFVDDPVGDQTATMSPGLLHKYHGRVLLITTAACAVHCRYCFRRHFPYHEHQAIPAASIDYIRQHQEISEVILSGGDPLLLSDEKLAGLMDQLHTIGHLKRLRIHTRLPVVLPARITSSLIELLRGSPLRVSMVIHANHANEIAADERHVLQQLSLAGISLLNQSVLLAGINDDADSLCQLSEQLFDAGVLPYYLHQLDRVAGAAHFSVTDTQALGLMAEMRRRLPGYLVPRLVREKPGEISKTPLFGL